MLRKSNEKGKFYLKLYPSPHWQYWLTYSLRHFKFFSATGGGGGVEELFGPYPRKHSYDNLIDSRFATANYWHKTRKSTKF